MRKNSQGFLLLILCFIGFSIFSSMRRNATPSDAEVLKQLQYAVDNSNQALPTMVDDETRFDSMSAGPGKQMVYHYTLIALTKEESDFEAGKEMMTEGLLASLRGNPDLDSFRKHGVSLVYSFKGKNGGDIGTITLTSDTY